MPDDDDLLSALRDTKFEYPTTGTLLNIINILSPHDNEEEFKRDFALFTVRGNAERRPINQFKAKFLGRRMENLSLDGRTRWEREALHRNPTFAI